MDIFEAIEVDHEKMRSMLNRLAETSPANRPTAVEDFKRLLLEHMVAEEKVLYPMLADGDDRDTMLEAMEEHDLIRHVLRLLESTPPRDERWMPRLNLLIEVLDHHHEEEEDEVFGTVQAMVDEEKGEDLAEAFDNAKEEAA